MTLCSQGICPHSLFEAQIFLYKDWMGNLREKQITFSTFFRNVRLTVDLIDD